MLLSVNNIYSGKSIIKFTYIQAPELQHQIHLCVSRCFKELFGQHLSVSKNILHIDQSYMHHDQFITIHRTGKTVWKTMSLQWAVKLSRQDAWRNADVPLLVRLLDLFRRSLLKEVDVTCNRRVRMIHQFHSLCHRAFFLLLRTYCPKFILLLWLNGQRIIHYFYLKFFKYMIFY